MKKLIIAALMAVGIQGVKAESNFDKNFTDETLRIDYIFAGDSKGTDIALRWMEVTPDWYGRRNRLDKLPLLGNGQVTVVSEATGDTIYRTSFSSLYTEWLDTEEAEKVRKSCEHSVMVPKPKENAKITVDLIDYNHDVMATLTHTYDPTDILVKHPSTATTVPYKYIHKAGDPKKVIDVAILAEGYTEEEMPEFLAKAEETVDAMFSHEPYKSMQDCFNFVAVMSPSKDSGMSVPLQGVWKDTAFGSHYSTHYSDRYLTTSNVFKLNDTLRGIPFEHIIILANSDVYGGGGIYNDYTLTTTKNANFRPVVVHEFGHSFGGLADEYFYPEDVITNLYPSNVEPWEQNITTMKDFDSKWKDQLANGTPVPTPAEEWEKYPVGVYEGAGYCTHGVYRPAINCRMKTNEYPAFCPVCQQAIKTLIEFYVK